MLTMFAALPENVVTYVSAVSDQVLVSSMETLTVPTSDETCVPAALMISPLTVPSKEEPFFRVMVRVELLPTSRAPAIFWASATSSAMLDAPLQPSSQTESRMSLPSLTSFTPLSVMTAWVFVTWNICPLRLVRLPPVMVKEEVPLSASPDMDW